MIGRIIEKLSFIFKAGENIILPPELPEKRRKEFKVEIFYLKSSEDLTSIRAKLGDVSLFLINITKLKTELKPIVDRLKTMGEQFGYSVYGLDPRWLILTNFEVERKD